jgi:trans-aconitate 2-methyltransferase
MTRDAWNPACYDRFRAERTQPFEDLLALVRHAPGMRVVDLGCGTAELTRRVHETLAARETLAIDSSDAMLERARMQEGAGLRVERGNISDFRAHAEFDLVFSNAALHWVPGHDELFRRLAEALTPEGQLAVQLPANFNHPSHTVATAVAAEEPFRTALDGGRHRDDVVLAPEAYASLLHRVGFRAQHVRLQVYAHELEASAEVVEWVRASLLTSYQRRLPSDVFDRFVARYRERLLAELGDVRPYLFTFKRLLLWADRRAALA